MRDSGNPTYESKKFTVVDLFSGAGGMSFGFHAHSQFQLVGAADAQVGKPSSRSGSLGCNRTYELNMGVRPVEVDLSIVDPHDLLKAWGFEAGEIDILSACPPCTGFSRTTSLNHTRDDPRNSLIGRVAEFANVIKPKVIVLENARELINGKQSHHLAQLTSDLQVLGYSVSCSVHMLTRFGLPQLRERALLIAAKEPFRVHTIDELWHGYEVRDSAVTVRHAIGALPRVAAGQAHSSDPAQVCPSFRSALTLQRLRAIPRDGGSWIDLMREPETRELLNPAQRRIIALGRLGSHPDVYGRMWWDRPARTLKRECAHVGNGRYSHPDQDRLCTVREMAVLQGFPIDYRFDLSSLANAYRHIGDAVPPLVAYQIASAVSWTLTGLRPRVADLCLPGTSLTPGDIVASDVSTMVA